MELESDPSMSDAQAQVRKVFITVKTYPTLSTKYDELVCTAGILDDGNWARIYPLPFRKLDYEVRYKKFQWIEVPLIKNPSDPRPESYKIDNFNKLKLLGEPVDTKDYWRTRKEVIFKNSPAPTDLSVLIEAAKKNELSLATFKPSRILDLKVESTAREWNQEQLDVLAFKAGQLSLFQTVEEVEREFKVVKKLPYKFSYRFEDCRGRESTLMVEDWEIGMLYWNCLEQTGGDERAAVEQVKTKFLNEFISKDLYFFLGTTRGFHSRAPNPFIIIGVFYPPVVKQLSLSF
jgi:hypothetical protein